MVNSFVQQYKNILGDSTCPQIRKFEEKECSLGSLGASFVDLLSICDHLLDVIHQLQMFQRKNTKTKTEDSKAYDECDNNGDDDINKTLYVNSNGNTLNRHQNYKQRPPSKLNNIPMNRIHDVLEHFSLQKLCFTFFKVGVIFPIFIYVIKGVD